MSVNKYGRRKQGRSDSDHDILGIVLIIISAFLLLCSIAPIIFGVVGEVLRNVILGLFGLSAYAMLALILASGIGLVMHRKLNVTGSRLALIIGMAVSVLLILQLATTNRFADLGYGDYLAAVYSEQITAGGLVFGTIAYGVKSLINLVFAYVLFSFSFLACAALLGLSLYKQYRLDGSAVIQRPVSDGAKQREKKTFTDDAPPQRVHMHSPTKLFVENIVTKTNSEVEDSEPDELFDGLRIGGDPRRGDRVDRKDAFNRLYDVNADVPRKVSEYDEQFLRNKAQSELYNSDDIAPQKGKSGFSINNLESYPDVHTASESEIKPKKPSKIFHESKNLPDLVIPKQKNDSNEYYNPNKIMNNDEAVRGGIISQSTFSAQANDEGKSDGGFYNSMTDSGIARDDGLKPFGSGTDNRNGVYNTFVKPENKEAENTAPIINSDYISRFEPEKESEEPKEEPKSFYNNDKHVGLYDSFSDFVSSEKTVQDSPIESKPQPNVNPIISTFDFERLEKEENEKAVEKNRERIVDFPDDRQSTIDKPTSSSVPENSFENPTEEKPAEFNSDTFIIDDTVVDLSEKREFSGVDTTGYYEKKPSDSNNFGSQKEKKSKIIGGQMDIENVPTVGADTVNIPGPATPYIYNSPPVSLLTAEEHESSIDTNDIESKSHDIEEVLASLKFPAKVVNVISGPTVTRYELQPQGGIPVRKILSLDKDLEFTLARGAIRIEAPVANKQAIGIEVANNAPAIVHFREIVESSAFQDTKHILPLALGKDIGGDAIVCNLEKMPHLLIAGTTGTGKSVCLNTLILSLIYKCSPEDVRIVLVDPKQVEFTLYRELPHLLLRNPITDVEYAVNALDWLIEEMNRRYDIFSNIASKGLPVRNLAEYNNCSLVKEGKAMKMPCIVMIVDELADLMSSRKKEVESRIRIITQKSRASGIHLVLATQRPSVDVITGTIKINLPSRIAFKVTANADSRTILDQGGAEALLGNGDMLLMNNSEPIRLQGSYVSNEEIVSVVEYVKRNNEACFDENIEKTILAPKEQAADVVGASDSDEESADEKLFPDIMRCFITNSTASTSLIQRRFSLGYGRASRIMDVLEMRKWVGPSAGAKPREVNMTESLFETVFGRPFNE